MSQVSREQAVEAAKALVAAHERAGHRHEFEACPGIAGIMARYLLQPALPAEAFDARAFVERCIKDGFNQFLDLNKAIDDRTAELCALIAAQGRAGDGIQRGWLCVGCTKTWPDKAAAEKCYGSHAPAGAAS